MFYHIFKSCELLLFWYSLCFDIDSTLISLHKANIHLMNSVLHSAVLQNNSDMSSPSLILAWHTMKNMSLA